MFRFLQSLAAWQSLLLVLTVLLSSAALAQSGANNGVITGRVVDSTGIVGFEGANITILGTQQRTVSQRDGTFRFGSVAPGDYQLEVPLPGRRSDHRVGHRECRRDRLGQFHHR